MNRAFFSLALALFLTPVVAHAAAAPEDTVKEIVGKLKANGDPGVVLEYVSWDDAFKETPPQVLQSLGVKDAAGLKEQTLKLMAEPAKFVRQKMVEKISTLPPEKQAEMNGQLDQLTQRVEKEFADMKEKLKRTDFTVGESEISGDTALVDISAKVDGSSQDNKLKLVSRNGAWLLASPEFGKRQQRPAGPPPGAPPGGPQLGGPNMSVNPGNPPPKAGPPAPSQPAVPVH